MKDLKMALEYSAYQGTYIYVLSVQNYIIQEKCRMQKRDYRSADSSAGQI